MQRAQFALGNVFIGASVKKFGWISKMMIRRRQREEELRF